MAPLVALIIGTVLARCAGVAGWNYSDSWPAAIAIGLALMFTLTSTAHWLQPRRDGLIAIVPSSLPRPALLVSLTGTLELAGAVGLLITPTRALAAGCLAVMLVVMFPANVRAAQGVEHPAAPRTPLLARTLLQIIFIAAAIYVAVQ